MSFYLSGVILWHSLSDAGLQNRFFISILQLRCKSKYFTPNSQVFYIEFLLISH
jgi:hypothetical protein